MTADEIMTMKFDECIVMMNHVSPFFDKKYPLEMHPQFMNIGDGDESKAYTLEKDERFLCVKKDNGYEGLATNSVLKDETKEIYKPKPLDEVLGDMLINIPDEDGYFLIKDTDANIKKSMMTMVRENADIAIRHSINENFKTALFDGDDMDIAMLRPLTVKMMNSHADEVNDVLIACNGVMNGHICYAGAKDDDCNIIKVLNRMHVDYERLPSTPDARFFIYKIKEALDEDKFGKLKDGCQKGHQVIIENEWNTVNKEQDDDFDDYMNF